MTLTLAAHSGVVLLPSPVSIDLTPPTASISTTPSANGNGWINATPVTVNMSATDSGSGVEQLRYWIDDGAVVVVPGASAAAQIGAEGTHTVGLRALDNAGNVSAPVTSPVRIDLTPPRLKVTASPSSLWPPDGRMVSVTVSGSSLDRLSGMDRASASFAVVDEYGTIQPSGPVTLGSGGGFSFPVSLQASRRSDDADGRHYTITVTAADLAGNRGSATAVVVVPHDQGH